nr:MAG TPA: hypothetical protein [Caudoviricetes sp.]
MFHKKKVSVDMIVPTSKISLKISCLSACENNIEKAEKLYNYLSADIASLPDFDPIQPTGLQRVKDGANEILGWINQHQEDFTKGLSILQSLRMKSNPIQGAEVAAPPIPEL